IEALAAGVPVVATAVGGVPDILRPLEEREGAGSVVLSTGEPLVPWRAADEVEAMEAPRLAASGLLVPPADARAVALALELLWTAPALVSECGRRGSAWVHEAFSVERLVSDIDTLYQDLLGARDSRQGEKALEEEAA
ncbi:MAG: glycosyltransferase, partial [Nitrospinota bacterium]